MNDFHFGTFNYLTIVFYMVVVVAMGIWFSHRKKTTEEYLLGGRNLPWWAVGISYKISILSTISMVMIPGEIYNNGLTLFIAHLSVAVTSLVGFFLCMRFYFRLKVFTPFEYLERRYDSRIRLLFSMLYFWTRLGYISMVLYATAKIFESAVGWPVALTIPIVGVIGVFYTFLGGMRAVVWTDVIQFVVLFGGILLIIVVICINVDGGFFGVISYALEHGRGPVHYADPEFYQFDPYLRLCFWVIIIYELANAIFLVCADQITVQRLLSTGSYQKAKYAAYTNSVLIVPMMLMLWVIGFAIFTYYAQNPDPSVTSGDAALYTFIATKIPAPLPGLILAAMLAAAMSTLDSGMNSLSAIILKDFYVKYINPLATEARQFAMARFFTIGVGAFAIAVSLSIATTSGNLKESVVEASSIWTSFTILLAPAFFITVTSRRITNFGIWLGLFSGVGVILGMTTWYVISKSGWVGAISPNWVLMPLSLAGLSLVLAAGLKASGRNFGFGATVLALCAFSYTLSTSLWYYLARFTEGGELSFQWVSFPGMIAFLIVGYGSLFFFKAPDEKKHFGLTLWSMGKVEIDGT